MQTERVVERETVLIAGRTAYFRCGIERIGVGVLAPPAMLVRVLEEDALREMRAP